MYNKRTNRFSYTDLVFVTSKIEGTNRKSENTSGVESTWLESTPMPRYACFLVQLNWPSWLRGQRESESGAAEPAPVEATLNPLTMREVLESATHMHSEAVHPRREVQFGFCAGLGIHLGSPLC